MITESVLSVEGASAVLVCEPHLFLFCAPDVCVSRLCTQNALERCLCQTLWSAIQKTSKASARHGSGLSVWRITPLIMCGATGMAHVQVMLRGRQYPGLATRCRTSTGDVVWFPCSREEMETEAFFFLFIPPQSSNSFLWNWLGCYVIINGLIWWLRSNVCMFSWQMLQSENVLPRLYILSSYLYNGKTTLVIDFF